MGDQGKSEFKKVVVIGAGSFGTAFANALQERGLEVWIWGRDERVIEELNETGSNLSFLPGVHLIGGLRATTDKAIVKNADLILLAVPSQNLRQVLESFIPVGIPKSTVLVSGSKGIELLSGKRMTEIVHEVFPENPCAVLAGPSHAEEVARRMPTAIVLGAADEKIAVRLQDAFTLPWLRSYTALDLIGIEIGGTFKNVVAIAAGIVGGLGLGDNAKAGLVTRGFAEMVRLGASMGAKPETFMGLSGMGDLIATCFSEHSRNTRVGWMLGIGKSLLEVKESMKMVAEGLPNTESVYQYAQAHSIRTPVTDLLYEVLQERLHPAEAGKRLLARSPRPEWG